MQSLGPGAIVDRYRVESELGQGGMAVVYRVTHQKLGSSHALKILLVPSEAVKRRLMKEGRSQARLRHPNLVSVTDVIDFNGAPALVMELVDGPSLERWLEDYRPTLAEALGVFRGILRGVAAAHRAGLVHRDLKPANVLLARTEDGLIPKVTDFGLVKVTEGVEAGNTAMGMGMGTPQYMSPEQIRDCASVDQRSDLFALGCLLYQLISGRRPFDGPDTLTIFNLIVNGEYRALDTLVPDCPPVVSAAVQRLLQVDPDRRPADCSIVADMLFSQGRVSDDAFAVPMGAQLGFSSAFVSVDEPTPIRELPRRRSLPQAPPPPATEGQRLLWVSMALSLALAALLSLALGLWWLG